MQHIEKIGNGGEKRVRQQIGSTCEEKRCSTWKEKRDQDKTEMKTKRGGRKTRKKEQTENHEKFSKGKIRK